MYVHTKRCDWSLMRFSNFGVFSFRCSLSTILELMLLRVIAIVCQLRTLAVWGYVCVVYVNICLNMLYVMLLWSMLRVHSPRRLSQLKP